MHGVLGSDRGTAVQPSITGGSVSKGQQGGAVDRQQQLTGEEVKMLSLVNFKMNVKRMRLLHKGK